jgi:hypothetical protein
MWWGVTEDAIKTYRGICPECLRKTKPVIPDNLQQLQFIFSETIGSRAQVDLIDFSRKPDGPFKWVLRYVDHHSGFAHVDCLPNKEAFTVGKSLIKILATAVIPDILQSDNGGEFTARCIEQIERHYPTIHIVKGRPRHPQSQGCVERGNGPFKEALDVWISQNPGVSWAEVGAYVVNGQINGRPSRQKGGRSPYEIYYGKQTTAPANFILSKEITMQAKSEYGLKGIQRLMEEVGKMNQHAMINTGDITVLVQKADNLFNEEEQKLQDGGKEEGIEKLNQLVQQFATSICARSGAVSITPLKSNVSGVNVAVGKRNAEEDNNNMAGECPEDTKQTFKKMKQDEVAEQDDSPGRKEIRKDVLKAKIKTAQSVNAGRKKKADAAGVTKKILEVNDICTLRLEGVIKSTFRHLPVLITEVVSGTKYVLATKHGYLKGFFRKEQLDYRENYTADILQINLTNLDRDKPLSVQQACMAFGGHASCSCQGDCSKISRCSCRAAGTFCTSLCHRGRGSNKTCTLFSDLYCTSL